MTLTADEVKDLNRKRIDTASRERAEKEAAVRASAAQAAFEKLLYQRTGFRGVQSGHVFYDCDANRKLLESYVEEKSWVMDHAALEAAFEACSDRLAQPPQHEYVRRVDLSQSRIMPQLRSFEPPPLILPYVKSEVLAWSKDRLKKEMGKSPRHLAALNSILQQK